MALEIFTYFNVQQVATVVDAIVAITASADYLDLFKLLAMIGFVVFVAGAAMGKQQDPFDFFRWALTIVLVNSVLLVPKVDVVIVDRTGGNAPMARANVPIGFAFFASITSHAGDYLTRTFETVFALPDDISFQQSGLMFGNTILLESLRTSPASTALREDLTAFVNNCTYYDVLEGRISANALNTSEDIWLTMKETSKTRLTRISSADTGSKACDEAYADIGARLGPEITAVMKMHGRILNPAAPTNDAAAAKLQGQLTTAYSHLLAIGKDATSIMRQSMMASTMRDSQLISAQQLDAPSNAIIAHQAAQVEVTTNQNFLAMARVAERALPTVRSVIEVICYAIFPLLILLLVIAKDSAGTILKGYVMTLVWIQLIPPLYAILNFVMTSTSQASLMGVMNGMSATGVTLQNLAVLGQQGISQKAIAGYMVISLPVIAWALVKAGEAGGAAIFSAVMSPTSSAGGQTAGAFASGNISQGAMALDTSSVNMHSANRLDTAPTARAGFTEVTSALGTATRGPDGTYRMRSLESALPFDASTGQKIANSLSSEASARSEVATRATVAATKAKTSALVDRMGVQETWSSDKSNRGSSESSETTRSGKTLSQLNQVAEAVNRSLGLDARNQIGRQLVGEVATGAEVSVKLPLPVVGAGGSASVRSSTSTSAGASQSLAAAVQLARNELSSRNVVADQALSDDFRSSQAYQWGESRQDQRINDQSASLTRAAAFTESAERATNQSLAFGHQAQILRDNWATMQVPLANYIAGQLERNGQMEAFLGLSQVDPQRAADMAAPYVQQYLPQIGPQQLPLASLSEVQAASPVLAGRTIQTPGTGFEAPTDQTTRADQKHRQALGGERPLPVIEDGTSDRVQDRREQTSLAVEAAEAAAGARHEASRGDAATNLSRERQLPGMGARPGVAVPPGSTVDKQDKIRKDLDKPL